MAKFIEKLQAVGAGEKPGVKALTFLSDLSMEDRTTLRAEWPNIPVERRRRIVDMLVTMAEDNIELHFRPVLLVALDDTDSLVRTAAIEGLYEDESKLLLDRLISILRTDPDSEVRESAAKALGRFTYLAQCDKLARGANPAHLREALLASTLDASEDSDVQRRSLEALGYLNGDEQVQKLIIDGYRQGGRRAESAVLLWAATLIPNGSLWC